MKQNFIGKFVHFNYEITVYAWKRELTVHERDEQRLMVIFPLPE